jgi:hypothetical protein
MSPVLPPYFGFNMSYTVALCRNCAGYESEHAGTKCLYAATQFEAHCCTRCRKPLLIPDNILPRPRLSIIRSPSWRKHTGCSRADDE